MKIQRFNEAEQPELDNEVVKDLITQLKNKVEELESFKEGFQEITNRLEKFTTNQGKNDQIDDSYIKLQEIKSLVDEGVVKLDEINSNLTNYLKQGRKYLY